MLGDAGGGHLFNSTFENWASASVVNPKNGFRFCREWFVTHVNRGQPVEIALEPLDPQSDSGVRLLLTKPPEQVRLWHALEQGAVEGGAKVVRIRVRGLQAEGPKLQLDSMALFTGNDAQRKVDRRLVGAVPLNREWHEFAVPLRSGGTVTQDQRYLSLRFSGAGKIEIVFCRLEDPVVATKVMASAKSFVAKLVTGFRRTAPSVKGGDGVVDEEHADVEPPLVVSATTKDIATVKFEPSSEQPLPAGPTAANVLANARFDKWSGNRPAHWSVSAPAAVTVKREAATREQPVATPCISVVFGESTTNQVVSIAQRVEGFAAQQFVDVVVLRQGHCGSSGNGHSLAEVALSNCSHQAASEARIRSARLCSDPPRWAGRRREVGFCRGWCGRPGDRRGV